MFRPSSKSPVTAVGLGAAIAAAASAPARAAGGLPDQGVYDQCVPAKSGDHCASRLRRIARVGFKVVQNMGALDLTDVPDIRAFADAAQANNLKGTGSLTTAPQPRRELVCNLLL